MDPKAYVEKMIATLKERTGKSMEEWLAEVRETLPAEKKGRVKWLKETYGMGQNTAMLILGHLEDGGEQMRGEAPSLVDAQYTKENAALRPVYDDLAARIQALGADVAVRPCKTYVPFYRHKTFVSVRPFKGKLHIGLAVPEGTEHQRLSPIEKGSERIKVEAVVTALAEIDDELMGLIRQAYEVN